MAAAMLPGAKESSSAVDRSPAAYHPSPTAVVFAELLGEVDGASILLGVVFSIR